MTFNIFFASFAALLVVSYWVLCRKRAYEYQKNAASFMEEYFADKQVLDRDKKSLYASYVLLRKWYVFPLFAFMTPGILIYKLLLNGNTEVKAVKRTKQEVHDRAFDQLMKMAISKNPIISLLSFSITGLVFAVLIPLGLLLKRINSVPSSNDYAHVMENLTLRAASKAHIH